MLEKAKTLFNEAKNKYLAQYRLPVMAGGIILAIILAFGGCGLLKNLMHPPDPITVESQEQAETIPGVQQAAGNAGVELSDNHAAVVAGEISVASKRPPDKIVLAEPTQIKKVIEQERQAAGADFSIVTDMAKPDQVPDLSVIKSPKSVTENTKNVIDSAKTDQKTQLNVYNIKAYPDAMTTYAAYLRFNGRQPEVSGGEISRQWHIGKGDDYAGIGLSYDKDRERGKLRGEVKYTHMK